MTTFPRLWRRVLYRRMTISLATDGWYERLAHATGPGGWQVVRARSGVVQLERLRFRLRFRPRRPMWNPPSRWPAALSRRILIANRDALTE